MRNLLLVIAGIMSLLSGLPYIFDSLKGKTKPNIASWSTWTLINGIAAVAALAAGGATNTVMLGFSYFVGSLTILLIAILKGTRKYTLFDGACQLIAVGGLVFWQISHEPNIALLFAITADIFASMPTIRHAYLYPGEETWITYAIAGMGAFLFLCLATSFSFAALAIPISFFLINSLLTTIILYRKNKLKDR